MATKSNTDALDLVLPGQQKTAGGEAEKGIKKVKSKVNPIWWERALYAVRYIAERRERLTTDDVWEQLEKDPWLPKVNGSAMGAVMRQSVEDGVIRQATGESQKSRRPQSHGRLLHVWVSKIRSSAAANS